MDKTIKRDLYFKIAIFAYMAFLFFEFFGTSIPFKTRVDTNKMGGGGGNIINQVVYTSIFLASTISLFVRRLDAIAIIKKEKLLTIFLLWCLLSVIWSYSPLDTVKRFFRIFTLFTVTLSLLVHTTSTKEILRYTKPVLYLYVFLSVIVCIVIPGAKDPTFHTWRGFADHKNLLGQVAVICTFLSFFIYKMEKGNAKLIAATAVLFSLALLFGSRSMTSISTFLIIMFAGSLISVDEIFKPLGLGRTASVTLFLFGIGVVLSILLISPEIIDTVTEAIGKDPSFSGRTDLWTAMFISISHHPFLGTGFQAFWSVSPPSEYLEHVYKLFVWIPSESHNSYIDITNQVGFIGLGIFIIMIFKYFFNLLKLNYPSPWKWFVITALIISMQESILFNVGHIVGSMLTISYLILFAQLWKQDVEYKFVTN
ncbi:MAG TPA: O-antigen ligase family protein [Ignavibacteriaceae bacterium]|nr:O-antigen ligase family protein [Ignavibacteriaceae bacterium]